MKLIEKTTYTWESDFAYDEATVEDAFAAFLDQHKLGGRVTLKVVEANGPGGGWPVVEWTTDDEQAMVDVIRAYANNDGEAVWLGFSVKAVHTFKDQRADQG